MDKKNLNKIIIVVALLLASDLLALGYIKTKEGNSKIASAPITAVKRILGVKISDQTSNSPAVTVHFLDIGQGDATYVEFPDGEDMLVDCAKDARVLAALGKVMPAFDRTIDYLFVTHPDADHYGGCIDVMKRFTVKHIYYNGARKENEAAWRYFWDTVQAEVADGGEYVTVEKEQTLPLPATIHLLYPNHAITNEPETADHAVNNHSLVFMLQYGNNKVLFTGDMEAALEEKLIAEYGKELDADVLKVGHHGSSGSSNQPFVDIVSPQYATISVGADNKYGHPSLRVLKRLERAQTQYWRTDLSGDITAKLDGTKIEVAAAK